MHNKGKDRDCRKETLIGVKENDNTKFSQTPILIFNFPYATVL